ncbi:hypothetical protein [Coraliomargarita akajimensis]|uniref:Uncharacterized protein n=1 Tax=Coraliomargarita akajimensis (strain DSM 45221 / IAM 15411 / JCM 23193 / KCTC 12865 / 04OKA010-24) TaxID=583355 RepID=D5ENP4_CORAD|nr:hypothetical protein [Coraliomargarita akajimensis]ADE53553.1 hypothetical protein Caka_0528 [Coraliomargarita akajimensis DSM 45221]
MREQLQGVGLFGRILKHCVGLKERVARAGGPLCKPASLIARIRYFTVFGLLLVPFESATATPLRPIDELRVLEDRIAMVFRIELNRPLRPWQE